LPVSDGPGLRAELVAKVVSLNVGMPREHTWRGKPVTSGIWKQPVAGRVAATGHNLAGDGQADLTVHGGRDKAVYAYPIEHYPFWRRELGVERLEHGCFGENLTTEGLLEVDVGIGDRFRVGSALLEVTQPRIPCHKLAMRHGRADLPKRFLASGRSGVYFAIVGEGELGEGDTLERIERDPHGISVADIQRLARGEPDEAMLRRAVEHPRLAQVWRDQFRDQLARGS